MSDDKRQKMMLGVLGVLVAGAAGAWYVARDSDATTRSKTTSGVSERRQRAEPKNTRAKRDRPRTRKAKPKAEKSERREREPREKEKSKRKGRKRGGKKTKKKEIAPAA